MIEQAIEIDSPDGSIDGFLYYAAEAVQRPGVIHLTDIGGIREAAREQARELAARGYTVFQPNLFYRTGRPPLFTFRPNFSDPQTIKRFGELAGPLTPEAIERDASAYVDFLSTQPMVSGAGLGVVGYCYSGGVALRIAAARPNEIAVALSFHGGRLYSDAPTSPHLLLPRVKARLYFGHAIKDGSMPEEAIHKLDVALAAWGGQYESETYDGAYHGWTLSDSAVYNPVQAERAFAKLNAFLAQALR
jgi:carboxymethylenebutenolidase